MSFYPEDDPERIRKRGPAPKPPVSQPNDRSHHYTMPGAATSDTENEETFHESEIPTFSPPGSPSKVAPNPFMNNSIYIGSQFRTAHLIRDPAQMTPRHAYNPPDVQTPIPPPTPPVPIKPIPTPVPNPDDPSVTSEPTLLPLPVYEPTCCSETLMYWITFTLLILLWIFTLASFFGPWAYSDRKEDGKSGIVTWQYSWHIDYYLTYYADSENEILYRTASDWRSECHHDGTWAAILFAALALVVLLGCIIAYVIAKVKYSLTTHKVINVLFWLNFIFIFFSLGFWLLGCFESIHNYTTQTRSTDASQITNTVRVSWGWGLLLLAWILLLAASIMHTVYIKRFGSKLGLIDIKLHAHPAMHRTTLPPLQKQQEMEMAYTQPQQNQQQQQQQQQQQYRDGPVAVEGVSMPNGPYQGQYETYTTRSSVSMNTSQQGQPIYGQPFKLGGGQAHDDNNNNGDDANYPPHAGPYQRGDVKTFVEDGYEQDVNHAGAPSFGDVGTGFQGPVPLSQPIGPTPTRGNLKNGYGGNDNYNNNNYDHLARSTPAPWQQEESKNSRSNNNTNNNNNNVQGLWRDHLPPGAEAPGASSRHSTTPSDHSRSGTGSQSHGAQRRSSFPYNQTHTDGQQYTGTDRPRSAPRFEGLSLHTPGQDDIPDTWEPPSQT